MNADPARERERDHVALALPLPRTIACSVNYGGGGLGQHLAQLIEEARATGTLARYYATGIKAGDEAVGRVVRENRSAWLIKYTPIRFSPGWINYVGSELYDQAVAAQMVDAPDHYVGFVGQALHSFRRARQLGCRRLELVAANSHVNNVLRRHSDAIRKYGIETSWLNETQAHKTRREYQMADRIQVASEYSRQSFLEEGVPVDRLVRVYLATSPRFVPPPAWPDDGVFRVVYTGSVTVMKGIPVLLDAFAQLTDTQAELTLVGGYGTRGMRRYLAERMARDQRVRLAPGDPLPHLQRADVLVHPTYEDGHAYAPMEALACGVPVIVTEDTGMKEHVRDGVNGYIVPAGDCEALLDRLQQIRRSPLRPVSPLP
jgi:glycosyltransferase involved in cell wall biosynthesis